MKHLLLLSSILFFFACNRSNTLLLDSTQSMAVTGLGEGQNASINPFPHQESIVIIKNISDKPFDVRIQRGKTIIEIVTITSKSEKQIQLKDGVAVYLDSDFKTKAKVSFKKGTKLSSDSPHSK